MNIMFYTLQRNRYFYNQKRINLTDRVEMVADLLKKYKKAGGGTPKSKRESGSVNLRDDHNRISC